MSEARELEWRLTRDERPAKGREVMVWDRCDGLLTAVLQDDEWRYTRKFEGGKASLGCYACWMPMPKRPTAQPATAARKAIMVSETWEQHKERIETIIYNYESSWNAADIAALRAALERAERPGAGLVEALDWYADEGNWLGADAAAVQDAGTIACNALAAHRSADPAECPAAVAESASPSELTALADRWFARAAKTESHAVRAALDMCASDLKEHLSGVPSGADCFRGLPGGERWGDARVRSADATPEPPSAAPAVDDLGALLDEWRVQSQVLAFGIDGDRALHDLLTALVAEVTALRAGRREG